AGGPSHHATGMTQIADEILDRMERKQVAAHILEHRGVAELASRQPPRVLRSRAVRPVFLLEKPEVKLELGRRVAILPRRKRRAGAAQKARRRRGHHPSCSTAATAAAIECQRAVSLASSRVPRLVNR